jgi:hypothetical protein
MLETLHSPDEKVFKYEVSHEATLHSAVAHAVHPLHLCGWW